MSPPAHCYTIESSQPQTHTIIFLHGRGSTGQELAQDLFECEVSPDSLMQESTNIGLKERFPTCRWIFPTARERYSTVFQEEMNEWFDIVSLTDPTLREDLQKPGLVEGVQILKEIIYHNGEPLDTTKLILCGISQGFAIAAIAVIALDLQFGGFVGLSGWLPFSGYLRNALSGGSSTKMESPGRSATTTVRRLLDMEKGETAAIDSSESQWVKTRMFLGHEKDDPVVAFELGEAAVGIIQASGADAEFHAYESGDHWIQEPDEINDIAAFIQICID